MRTPSNIYVISRPKHYVEGRTFEPIEVIEAWGLCHHLGCVVKYIARAGRKHDAVCDLQKAVWYVERELTLIQQDHKGPCNKRLYVKTPDVEQVASDWKLSPNLEVALSYLKNEILHPSVKKSLTACKSALQEEIASLTHKEKEDSSES